MLSDRGLGSALEALAGRIPLPVEIAGDARASGSAGPIEAAAYFVVAEAITNVARYAEASHADGRGRRATTARVVRPRSPTTASAAPTRRQGSGLRGLADRVAALDGRLEVASPPGAGTTIRAVIPA